MAKDLSPDATEVVRVIDGLLRDHRELALETFGHTLSAEHLEALQRAYDMIRGACAAAATHREHAIAATTRGAFAAADELAHALVTMRADADDHAAERTRLEDDLAASEALLANAAAEHARAIEREREATQRAIERARAQHETTAHFAALDRDAFDLRAQLPLRTVASETDAVLGELDDILGTLEQLAHSDVANFEALEIIDVHVDGARVERTLTDETIALAHDIAPLKHRKQYELGREDLAFLRTLQGRYERLRANAALLTQLIGDLDGSSGSDSDRQRSQRQAEERLASCRVRMAKADQLVEAVRLVTPDLFDGRDPFLLVGTSIEELKGKHRRIASARAECDELVASVRRQLRTLRDRYTRLTATIAEREADLAQLLAMNDLTWFEALTSTEQRTVCAAVLAFASTEAKGKRHRSDARMSVKQLAAVLIAGGILTEDDAQEEALEALLRPEFFSPVHRDPVMQQRVRMYRLTEDGEYWSERWRREDPQLVVTLVRAHAAVAERNSEEEAQRTRDREERTCERRERRVAADQEATQRAAARDAEQRRRAHPASVIERLGTEERQLLAFIVRAFADLPKDPNPHILVKVAAAAANERIVGATRPDALCRAIRALLAHRTPVLIGTTQDEAGRRTLALSPDALRLQPLLPSIAAVALEEARRLLRISTKLWPPAGQQRFTELHKRFQEKHQHGVALHPIT